MQVNCSFNTVNTKSIVCQLATQPWVCGTITALFSCW